MTKMTLLRVAAAAILAQCSALALALDPLSYARYDQVKTSALHMDLKADFAKKTLSGFAELSLDWLDKSARTLDLDTRDLSISKVEAQDAKGKWKAVPFTLDKRDAEKGQAMHVKLAGQPEKVRIHYRTAPTATALQWLDAGADHVGQAPVHVQPVAEHRGAFVGAAAGHAGRALHLHRAHRGAARPARGHERG